MAITFGAGVIFGAGAPSPNPITLGYRDPVTTLQYLVVGGGGGGGSSPGGGGGGSGGGVIYGNLTIPKSATLTATIGGGGGGGASGINNACYGFPGSPSTLVSPSTLCSVGLQITGIGGAGLGRSYYGGACQNTYSQIIPSCSTVVRAPTSGISWPATSGLIPGYGGPGANGGRGGVGPGGAWPYNPGSFGGGCGSRTTCYGGSSGQAYTGGGGGGGASSPYCNGTTKTSRGGDGGSGSVVLAIPTRCYTANLTGSYTTATSGGNTIVTFTGPGTYSGLPLYLVQYLVVAGGGAGGSGANGAGGGGGGGGVLQGSVVLIQGTSYSITVGGVGSPSSFSNITATGGGSGGAWNSPGNPGGSGGGGTYFGGTGGAGIPGQGNPGGSSGGYHG